MTGSQILVFKTLVFKTFEAKMAAQQDLALVACLGVRCGLGEIVLVLVKFDFTLFFSS